MIRDHSLTVSRRGRLRVIEAAALQSTGMNGGELALSEEALTQEEMMQSMRHGSVGSHWGTKTVMDQAVQDLRSEEIDFIRELLLTGTNSFLSFAIGAPRCSSEPCTYPQCLSYNEQLHCCPSLVHPTTPQPSPIHLSPPCYTSAVPIHLSRPCLPLFSPTTCCPHSF